MTEKQKNILYEATQSRIVNFNEIGITNDLMFGTVYKDPEYCKELLQRILQINIVEIGIVEPQKTIKTTMIGKGIRIDIYAKDNQGNVYDIEMQSTEETDLHLRTRYYHSEMDSYQIRAGQKYKNLKNSVVIFICTFDPFKDNRSIYTFQTICKENKGIILEDKRLTYFVNIYGSRDGISRKTVDLLDYFKTGKPTDIYTKNIQDQVEIIRDDNEWRENYMTIEMKLDQKYEDGLKHGRIEGEKFGRIEGEKIGRTEGEIEKEKELIAKWLQKGKTIAAIAEDLDKTEIYVKNLMKQL